MSDPQALEYDALSMDWMGLDFYDISPSVLLSRVLTKVVQRLCRVTLIAPVWVTQACFTSSGGTCAVTIVARSAQLETETGFVG